jgi:hypothetical protein
LLLSFTVIEHAGLIELLLAVEPLDNEIFIEDLLIVEDFHEGRCVLQLVGMPSGEEQDYRLEKLLCPNLAILLHQSKEGLLKLCPILDDAVLRS